MTVSIQNNQPIGIFDSGVGGLSVTKCITSHLPNEKIIYVADSLYAPYGDNSIDLITKRVNTIADWFISQHCKAIVVACNTATVNAIDQLRDRLSIPIIGVEPAIKPAAQHSKTKSIGVLVTQATAINQRFLNLINTYKNGANVVIQPCLGLVELIESGQMGSPKLRQLLTEYLTVVKDHNIDTLVLGCTHYPFINDVITDIVGDKITIMETALPVTKQLEQQLIDHNIRSTSTDNAQILFYSSLVNNQQQRVFNTLWNGNVTLKKFI